MNNFDNIVPTSARAVGRMAEQERLKEQKELEKERKKEEYDQQALLIAKESKQISEQALKETKKSVKIAIWTLVISGIGAFFTILSFFKN